MSLPRFQQEKDNSEVRGDDAQLNLALCYDPMYTRSNEQGQKMQDLYERSLLESSLVSSPIANAAPTSGTGKHATGAQFDALEMDSFTGFHTLSQEMIERIVRVREASSDIEFVVDSNELVSRTFRQVTDGVFRLFCFPNIIFNVLTSPFDAGGSDVRFDSEAVLWW